MTEEHALLSIGEIDGSGRWVVQFLSSGRVVVNPEFSPSEAAKMFLHQTGALMGMMVAAEREECAKIADEENKRDHMGHSERIAAVIRGRGQP